MLVTGFRFDVLSFKLHRLNGLSLPTLDVGLFPNFILFFNFYWITRLISQFLLRTLEGERVCTKFILYRLRWLNYYFEHVIVIILFVYFKVYKIIYFSFLFIADQIRDFCFLLIFFCLSFLFHWTKLTIVRNSFAISCPKGLNFVSTWVGVVSRA